MENQTKTEVKPTMMEELSRAGSKLAVVSTTHPPAGVAGYAPWSAPPMTQERKDFLKRQFCPPGCPDVAFEFFLAYCERTQLDPVIKQAYLVERNAKVNGNWVTKYEPMSAEAGMAARADAMPDFEGIDDGVVYEHDEFSIDYANGIVVHKSPHAHDAKKRGRIIGAWAHVHRKGRRVPITWLRVEERVQLKKNAQDQWEPNIFWSKMTATQILKCARAEQWRQAYPNLFSGEYVPEEVNREEIELNPPTQGDVEQASRPTADKLADQVKPKSSPPATTQAPSSPAQPKVTSTAGGVTIDVQPVKQPEQQPPPKPDVDAGTTAAQQQPAASNVVQLPSQQAAAKKAEAPKPDPEKVTVFGDEHAPLGTEITKLEGPVLFQLIALGESKVGTIRNAARKAEVRTSIDAMMREKKRRDDALIAETEKPAEEAPPREPGQDDGEF